MVIVGNVLVLVIPVMVIILIILKILVGLEFMVMMSLW
jgi:hypothetical protein